MSAGPDIRTAVREKYAEIATGEAAGCGCACDGIAQHIGYARQDLEDVPAGANLGLGCGNPLQHAAVRAGEAVLDLGSGAGMDAFLAARATGPGGRVIGVDMTPAMIEKARAHAAAGGFTNVEFRLGEIEQLPVADASVDVVISNCVINLSPEKDRVFREAFRVLRPGGRMLVSDLVLGRPLPEEIRSSVEAYVGCVAGASLREEYLGHIRTAGFTEVEVVEERTYGDSEVFGGAEWLRQAATAVTSAKVRAVKPPA
ncbi:MAG: arsenite methyltransferase [Gemmatimonadetes bacterium]|nr:arsenite methyltransferase [Gemmatimonadota bacterium]